MWKNKEGLNEMDDREYRKERDKIVEDIHALEGEINKLNDVCDRLWDVKEKARDNLEMFQSVNELVKIRENPAETISESQKKVVSEKEEKTVDMQPEKKQVNQFCPYCGASVNGQKFCGQCGKQVN